MPLAPQREPNLRHTNKRHMAEVRQRAALLAGHWSVEGRRVLAEGDGVVAEAVSDDHARHIAEAHNHLLPLFNQLHYRVMSAEDLAHDTEEGAA